MSFQVRKSYQLVSRQAIRWFPGHMGKGLKQMQQRLKQVDCIIEVHDARVPYSGRNPELQQTIIGDGVKPHILVLNKKDLTEIRDQRRLAQHLREHDGIQNVVFTNCKDQRCQGIRRLLPLAGELVANSERYNRASERDTMIMIVGVPNVGKSSLLNVLRNRHLGKKGAAKVGGEAGITRSVMERIKISDDPLVYMIDTPGILEPSISDDEMGMKLALVGCLPDHLVGEEIIADYLLYWLNAHKRFEYAPLVGLQQPTDNVIELLVALANRLNVKRKIKRVDGQVMLMPDILLASQHFIKLFRRGDLGAINLDSDFMQQYRT